jgi:hypothetical protein
MATRSFPSLPVIHFHGMLFFVWTLYFAFQTWLAASGRIARHRTIGMIGVSLATAMTIFGFLAAVSTMKRSAAIGLTDAGVAFAIVPLSGILFFAVVFTVAVANTRDPETHKRLMLLAGISILDAAVARWFLTFLSPPGSVGPPPSRSPSFRPLSPTCFWSSPCFLTGVPEGVRIPYTSAAVLRWWRSNS